MHGDAFEADASGAPINTAEADCQVCKCDLFLSAVVSPLAPGQAVCPEHACQLGVPSSECTLLFRWGRGRRGELFRVAVGDKRWGLATAALPCQWVR